MPRKSAKKKTADELEKMVSNGESIADHIPSKLSKDYHKKLLGKLEKHVLRTTVDFGYDIVKELEAIAAKNNISKSAVIKSAVLDYIIRFRSIYPK